MSRKSGFTLLEVLIVIGIMGLIAAMVWPMRGTLDDSQRERVTNEKMDAIAEAMLGHEHLKDPLDMRRTIGGYVGDMRKWPDLYEPGGTGVGGARGEFVGGRFQWTRPFTKVTGAARAAESLGQPRGLWTKDELAVVDRNKWKGPYLTPPVTRNPALGRHYAKNQAEYINLALTDRAFFHLLQGSEQLTDGWNRAFRFFISQDSPGGPDDGLFWIVSLGADGMGDFPTDMVTYDAGGNPPYHQRAVNKDNVIRVLQRSDWEAVLATRALRSASTQQLIFITQDHMDRIVRALIGASPAGPNTGYTGDLLGWPALFNWVCTGAGGTECAWRPVWDDPAFPNVSRPYTYGQPRGLWTRGDLPESRLGVGWRHAYLEAPAGTSGGTNEAQLLLDAWNRPHHFFRVMELVSGNNVEQFMILSGGEDGNYDFPVPAGHDPNHDPKTANFALADYDPAHVANQDNILRIVRRNEWLPGFLDVTVAIPEAIAGADCANVRCRMYGVLPGQSELLPQPTAPSHGLCEFKATYNDKTATQLVTGGRYLVCWGDTLVVNDLPDSGEPGWWKIFSTHGHPAKNVNVSLSASDFSSLP